jgi:hypothetical protein
MLEGTVKIRQWISDTYDHETSDKAAGRLYAKGIGYGLVHRSAKQCAENYR